VVVGKPERDLGLHGELVEPRIQDGFHGAEREATDGQGPVAGRFEPLRRMGSSQLHEPQTAAVALFRMGSTVQEPLDERGGLGSYGTGPGDEPGRTPLQVGPMMGGHVVGVRGVPTAPMAAGVGSYPVPTVEELDGGGGDASVQLRPAQGVGHAVVVEMDLDVVVDVHPDLVPLGELVGCGGQGQEGRLIQRLEETPATAFQLLEGAPVQVLEEGPEGPPCLGQGEEGVVAKRGQDPALHGLNGGLNLRFQLRVQHRERGGPSRHMIGAVERGV